MLTASFPRFLAIVACFRHADQVMVAGVPLVGGAVFGLGPQEIGWMVAAQGSAWLIMSLPFGVLVDRMRPMAALMRGLGLMAAGLALAVGGLLSGHAVLFTMAAFVTSAAVVMGFLAEGATVQRIVPAEGLSRANARMQIVQSAAMLAGPLVMGVLIARGLALAGLLLGAALVLAGLALAMRFPLMEAPRPRERQPLAEIREGLTFVAGQPLLRGIVVCSVFWNMAAFAMAAFYVPYALKILDLNADSIGTAQAAQGVGSFLAALTVGAILARTAPRSILFFGPLSSTVAALLLFAEPAIGGFPASVGVFFLLGFGPILWFVCQNTIRQLVTPQGMLGRVGAVIQIAIYGVRSFGALVGGYVATTYGFAAGIWLVVALFALSTLTVPLSALGSLVRLPESSGQPDTAGRPDTSGSPASAPR